MLIAHRPYGSILRQLRSGRVVCSLLLLQRQRRCGARFSSTLARKSSPPGTPLPSLRLLPLHVGDVRPQSRALAIVLVHHAAVLVRDEIAHSARANSRDGHTTMPCDGHTTLNTRCGYTNTVDNKVVSGGRCPPTLTFSH